MDDLCPTVSQAMDDMRLHILELCQVKMSTQYMTHARLKSERAFEKHDVLDNPGKLYSMRQQLFLQACIFINLCYFFTCTRVTVLRLQVT